MRHVVWLADARVPREQLLQWWLPGTAAMVFPTHSRQKTLAMPRAYQPAGQGTHCAFDEDWFFAVPGRHGRQSASPYPGSHGGFECPWPGWPAPPNVPGLPPVFTSVPANVPGIVFDPNRRWEEEDDDELEEVEEVEELEEVDKEDDEDGEIDPLGPWSSKRDNAEGDCAARAQKSNSSRRQVTDKGARNGNERDDPGGEVSESVTNRDAVVVFAAAVEEDGEEDGEEDEEDDEADEAGRAAVGTLRAEARISPPPPPPPPGDPPFPPLAMSCPEVPSPFISVSSRISVPPLPPPPPVPTPDPGNPLPPATLTTPSSVMVSAVIHTNPPPPRPRTGFPPPEPMWIGDTTESYTLPPGETTTGWELPHAVTTADPFPPAPPWPPPLPAAGATDSPAPRPRPAGQPRALASMAQVAATSMVAAQMRILAPSMDAPLATTRESV